MARKLTVWKAGHPANECKAVGQRLKKDMQRMSKQELGKFYPHFLNQMGKHITVGAKRNEIMTECRSLAEEAFKLRYAEQQGFLLFAKWMWPSKTPDTLYNLFHKVVETPLYRTYNAWITMNKESFKNDIIQVLPHLMKGHNIPDHVPEEDLPPQRPAGWRVMGDPETSYFLNYSDALLRAVQLQQDGLVDFKKERTPHH